VPIPIEVVAAQMALSHPDEFTAEEREMAEQILNEWQEVPCPHCVVGWLRHEVCRFCLGDGKVWVRT
jgi:hypothetical protein